MKKYLLIALTLLTAVATQAQVSFTASDWANAKSLSNGDVVTSYTQDGVTITFAQGDAANGATWNKNQQAVAAVAGNTMTIRAKDGEKVLSAVLTMYANSQANNLAAASWDSGKAEASEKTVTWTGSAQAVTVAIANVARFVSFAVTTGSSADPGQPEDPEVPEGEDESVYNDTTVITAKEWLEEEGYGPGDGFFQTQFTKEGKTVSLDGHIDAYNEALMRFSNSILTITSSVKMHKILFQFATVKSADRFITNIVPEYSVISGKLQLYEQDESGKTVVWLGGTGKLQFAVEATITLEQITIISDKTDTNAKVVFVDADGKTLSEQQVPFGGSATPPSDPTNDNYCLTFKGWSESFSEVYSDLTIRPEWDTIADCFYVPEGYVEVIFVDAQGNIIDRQAVPVGGTAVAPEAPALFAHTFIGWSAPLTNITESQTIQALYAFDKNSPDIMTVPQWVNWTQEHRWDFGTQVIVKGIVNDVITKLEEGGKLTFRFSEDGENDWEHNQAVAYGAHVLGLNGKPFANHLQLEQGDTVYVLGAYESENIDFGYYYYYSQEVVANGHLAYLGKAKESEDRILFYGHAPDAALLYDFSGNGLKQIVSFSTESMGEEVEDYLFTIWASGDATQLFSGREELGSGMTKTGFDTRPLYFEDINRDGKTDVTTLGSVFMSQADGYTMIDQAMAVTNMDINRDGRPDYLLLDRSTYLTSCYANYGSIMYQLPDGSFRKELMQVMNWDEFVAQMTPEEADQYNNPQNYSLGDVSRYTYTIQLGGASLAHAPRRDARRSPGIGSQVYAPTKAVDMNGDGLVDLIDEKAGVIYTNMDNGKWVWTQTNGTVVPVDLNGDGVTDFIFPGAKLYTVIYDKAQNTFVSTMLYQNATVDDRLYCYDFDHDGDIDILATFSAATNATGYAYTCFFLNDGQGHFTQQPEQSYGNLLFSACQDIDGDGYMDLLSFRSAVTVASESSAEVEVVWLQGKANHSFAAPQRLYSFYIYNNNGDSQRVYNLISNARIHVEDLDNDGKMNFWVSGVDVSFTQIYPMETAAANTRPTAPAAPALTYKDGLLTITWGNGSDNTTAVNDLTYALRIGITAGGNEILAAHANADGTRRNFLDGNMGRMHQYTIDLRSYEPATIHVAVQAIDAQHTGSAWSAEATVAHENLPTDFILSSDKINFNETVKINYTALPEGYQHSWNYADGKLLHDGEYMELSFPTAGEKTIKHTITAPSGKSASTSKIVTVLPAGLGTVVVENIYDESNRSVFSALAQPLADFNYDGRLDGVSVGDYSGGNYYSATVQTGNKDKIFQKAAGLWNTNILSDGERFNYTDEIRWLDWNRDGHVDLLMTIEFKQKFAQLLHAPNGAALTAREDNDTLKLLFGTWWKENKELHEYYTLNDVDFLHSGRPTIFYQHPQYEHYVINFAEDGSLEEQKLKATTQQELFGQILENHAAVFTADFDHDGWTDLASLYSNTDTWSGLTVFFNRGNGRFEYALIPFVSPLQLNTDKCHLADFNGDGFQDLIVSLNTENAESYILWNNANNTFSAPELLPNSQNIVDNIHLTDIDNNGHLDLMARTLNPAEGEGWQGVYVWYMGAEGLLSHGFLQPKLNDSSSPKDFYLASDEHVLLAGSTLYSIAAQSDERPAAPTNVRASLTDEGLLIEWDAAKDDHTTVALMRYNLSVRRDGAETYIISPQNGGNDKAQYLPGHPYINATRFIVPLSELTSDTYEIRLQALDRQNKLSVFSETLLKEVVREPIEAPSFVCANDYITVSFRGETSTGTPVWDFDGAKVQSGSGFGPYSILWEMGGEKTITLTLDGKQYTRTITVDDPSDVEVYLPAVLYEGTPATITLPDDVRYAWYASVNGSDVYPITEYGILLPSTSVFVSYDRRLTTNGLSVTAHAYSEEGSLSTEEVVLYLKITNTNGCEAWFMRHVTVLEAKNIPTIQVITTEENGHNRIAWTSEDATIFSSIHIYKEGAALNDFQLIGSAPAADGSFIDGASDATQKAERYRITGVTSDGSESPASTIHQTVHLTISKGVVDGTFNLNWNAYVGVPVSSYQILRGESPNYLRPIETLASSNTSYTDKAPVDAQPYYAIEYYLDENSYYAPSIYHTEPLPPVYGRSNVVDRRNTGEGIEDIQVEGEKAAKILHNGTLYILTSDNKIYDATGLRVK